MQQKQENFLIGQRYKIGELIGQGAFGKVFKGLDKVNGMNVAIKIQSEWSQDEKDLLMRFQNVTFTNIINVFDVFEESCELIIIMEYAEGGDLLDYLSRTKLNQSERKNIVLQISKGLLELHEKNLVYRDMKPENIIVLQDQNQKVSFKLCDFGLVKQDNMTETMRVGTPYYQAPELLRINNQNYKSEVDIWALGCVYYEIITSNSLFIDNTVVELQKQIQGVKQEWIDAQIDQLINYNVNERDRKLLKLMISKIPKRRPNILEVIKTLNGSEDFLNHKPIIIIPNKIGQPSPSNIKQTQNPPLLIKPTINQQNININLNQPKPPIQRIQIQLPSSRIPPPLPINNQNPVSIIQHNQPILHMNMNTNSNIPFANNPLPQQNILIPCPQQNNPYLKNNQLKEQDTQQNTDLVKKLEQDNQLCQERISKYNEKIQKLTTTVTFKFDKTIRDIDELNKIKLKTMEIDNAIKSLLGFQQQYEEKLQLLKNIKIEITEDSQIQTQIDHIEQIEQEYAQIEQQQNELHIDDTFLCQKFKEHLLDRIKIQQVEFDTKFKHFKILIMQRKLNMEKIMNQYISGNITGKDMSTCKNILNKILNEQQIVDSFNQRIIAIELIYKENQVAQKSLVFMDQDLQMINFYVDDAAQQIQQFQQNEKIDQQKFEDELKYNPAYPDNYYQNQLILEAKISNMNLIYQILRMKDQKQIIYDIQEEIMKVYRSIKDSMLTNQQM